MTDKKWKGIRINEVRLMGTVPSDPQIIQVADNSEWAYFTVRTMIFEPGTNGQYHEIDMDVPVVANTPDKVRVVRKYVKAGRELHIAGYYKCWEANGTQQHAVFVNKIILGRSPFTQQDTPQQDTPELPY